MDDNDERTARDERVPSDERRQLRRHGRMRSCSSLSLAWANGLSGTPLELMGSACHKASAAVYRCQTKEEARHERPKQVRVPHRECLTETCEAHCKHCESHHRCDKLGSQTGQLADEQSAWLPKMTLTNALLDALIDARNTLTRLETALTHATH